MSCRRLLRTWGWKDDAFPEEAMFRESPFRQGAGPGLSGNVGESIGG